MDTCPDFTPYVHDIEGKAHKKDALRILKQAWGLLSKEQQKGLYELLSMAYLSHKQTAIAKEELEEYKHMIKSHPEVIEQFHKFYSKVITPVSSKDQFYHDRIHAAAGLEKGIKELQQKHLIHTFEMRRSA